MHKLQTQIWIISGLITATFLILLTSILIYNNGHFVYTLDDPYISLRIAENISRGSYGLNLNEFSTPSSSIIWPFLLALFIKLPFPEFSPILINFICTIMIGALMVRILDKKFPNYSSWVTFFILILANVIGLIFSGLEHSLQVLLAVLIIAALINLTEKKELPKWLPFVLILAPLVRYELLSISLGAIALLLLHRKFNYLYCLVIIIIIMGSISAFLWLKTGYIIPCSTLTKLEDIKNETYPTISLILMFAASILFMVLNRKNKNIFLLFAYIAAIVLAHIIFGRNFFLGRYEAYVMVAALIVICYHLNILDRFSLFKKPLDKWAPFFLLTPLILKIIAVPQASYSIYLQQYQMAKLIKDLSFPVVAANDVGLISYNNPSYVVDLWGLGNMESKKYWKENSSEWLLTAEKHNAELVMIYPQWFIGVSIPANWKKLGRLEIKDLDKFLYTAVGGQYVDIYITSPKTEKKINRIVDEWENDLPADAAWVEN